MRERMSPAFVKQIIEPGNDYCKKSPGVVPVPVHIPHGGFQHLVCWDTEDFPKEIANWSLCTKDPECCNVSTLFRVCTGLCGLWC